MQNVNPLFPSGNDETPQPDHYILPKQQVIKPLGSSETQGANPAADLIREKLERIYAQEPDVLAEEREAKIVKPRSKHQQFMYELSTSGKSLATIQTDWHNYYAGLSDAEKHEVWQEFYEDYQAAQQRRPTETRASTHQPPAYTLNKKLSTNLPPALTTVPGVVMSSQTPPVIEEEKRSPSQIRQTILNKVSSGGRLRPKHHLQSLGFGIGVGFVVLLVFMFSFFNEVIIAPFIQPSLTASATPIIVDPSSVSPSSTPQVIIPKINVDIPVDFSERSTNENVIENDLESGVVHYPTTVLPGQDGNTAYFGHSSNNIFNPGKYKFAFVLLHTIQPGDTFYLVYSGKVYIYKVFERQIVNPTDLEVLSNIPNHTATATLITCDPPGTSINRLIVVGDQISPDPSTNIGGNNTSSSLTQSTQLPGNGPTLLGRFFNWLF